MGMETGVGMEGPNQATTATMEPAQGALAVAVRGVPEEPAREDQEAGDRGARAALEEQARGVLGQTQATTHEVALNGAR